MTFATHLAGPQPALEHEQEHGFVAMPCEGTEELRHLLVSERPRQALCRPHTNDTPHRMLFRRETQKGCVSWHNAHPGDVRNLPQRVFSSGNNVSENDVLIEGGNRSEDAIHGSRRKLRD